MTKLGFLDLLCMIPQDEVEIEDGLSKAEIKKWDLFWEYFTKTWISILDSWNICLEDGSYKNLMNRTNNGLERGISCLQEGGNSVSIN